MSYLKIILLFIISFPFLSRTWGVISKIETPAWLVKKIICFYKEYYKIDMAEFEGGVEDYNSLSSFFIRKIDPDVRPLNLCSDSFLSPADGKITAIEKINADITTLVKGKTYKISELLRKELDFSEGFYVVTIYLSPKDYHRYHVPVSSKVLSYIHTGWRLFPVNSFSVNEISNLFIKNERVIVKFDREGTNYFYVAVGATFVGSIKMDFFENPIDEKWIPVNKEYQQNEELGRFEMGSTIVLVIPEKMIENPLISKGDVVKAGQPFFLLKKN